MELKEWFKKNWSYCIVWAILILAIFCGLELRGWFKMCNGCVESGECEIPSNTIANQRDLHFNFENLDRDAYVAKGKSKPVSKMDLNFLMS